MERHCLGSQTFVPVMGTPFVVLVALGVMEPDFSTLKAVRADGSAGITLVPDVWHHPLLALAAGDFVVLELKWIVRSPTCRRAYGWWMPFKR